MSGFDVVETATDIAFIILSLALLLGFVRLVLGPSLPDRVVALDLLTLLAMAYAALYAISADEQAFLDVSIALALVAFLATVAFARFCERRQERDAAEKSPPTAAPTSSTE